MNSLLNSLGLAELTPSPTDNFDPAVVLCAPMSAGGRQPEARGGVRRDWRAIHPLVYEYYASLCEAQNLNRLFAHPLIVAFGSFRRFCGVFDRFGLPSITD